MAIIIDVLVDAATRRLCADEFLSLETAYLDWVGRPYPATTNRGWDRIALAQRFGVQPRTLDGWIVGRGQPIPRSADNYFALVDSELQPSWRDRVICGLGLAGLIEQQGIQGSGTATYIDEIGAATLCQTLDRVIERYLTRNVGSKDWYDISWRKLTIEQRFVGEFRLVVEYETGISGQDETEN